MASVAAVSHSLLTFVPSTIIWQPFQPKLHLTDSDFVSITRNGELCDEEGGLGPHEFDQVMREQVRAHTLQSLSIDTALMLPHEEAFSRRGSAKMILMELQRLGDVLDRLQPGNFKLTSDTTPSPSKHPMEHTGKTGALKVFVSKVPKAIMTGQDIAASKRESVGTADVMRDVLNRNPATSSQHTSLVETVSTAEQESTMGESPSASNTPGPDSTPVRMRSNRPSHDLARNYSRRLSSASVHEADIQNLDGSVGSGGGWSRSRALKSVVMSSSHPNLGSMTCVAENTQYRRASQPLIRALSDYDVSATTASHNVLVSSRSDTKRARTIDSASAGGKQRHSGVGDVRLAALADVQVAVPAASAVLGTLTDSFCDCSARPRLQIPASPPRVQVANLASEPESSSKPLLVLARSESGAAMDNTISN